MEIPVHPSALPCTCTCICCWCINCIYPLLLYMSILLSVLSDASVDYLFRPHSLIQFFSIFFPFFFFLFFFVVLLRFLFLFSSHTLPLFPLLFRSIPVKQADLSLSSLSLSLSLCLMYLLPPLFASLYYPRATPLSSLPSSSPSPSSPNSHPIEI